MDEEGAIILNIAKLIEARSETRERLQQLAREAYERWQELEYQVQRLEHGFDAVDARVSETRIRVTPKPPPDGGQEPIPCSAGGANGNR